MYEIIKKLSKKDIILVLILFLALALRMRGLATRDVWYDEALSVQQASRGWVQIYKEVATPTHYYFVKLFSIFGRNTFTLGLPSVMFGVSSVYLLFLIAKKLGGDEVGLSAALLLAVSPMAVEFSQQILHYSYFMFFTLLVIYYLIRLLDDLKQSVINVRFLGLYALANILNILTQTASLYVAAMSGVFLIANILVNPAVLKKYRYQLLLFMGICIAGIIVFLNVGSGYYVGLFTKLVNYGPSHPLELGYSLARQMDSTTLDFSLKFYLAMFSWFGLGPGIRLFLYTTVFAFGVMSMIGRKKIRLLSFVLLWTFYPFLQLYFVRPSHWFEEKYFFFILPVYLLGISYGLWSISELTSKYLEEIRLRVPLRGILSVLLVLITFLAITPLRVRTTYGFPLDTNVEYSWRAVHEYLKGKMVPGDRVFVRDGEDTFFDFYFGSESKNKVWFTESYFLLMDSDEYERFRNSPGKNYFVSIPDFKNLYLSGSAKNKLIDKIANFQIHEITFEKKLPIALDNSPNVRWQYYDDFSYSKMFADASYWKNVGVSYLGNYNLPMTYGYYHLASVNNKDSEIVYPFSFKVPPAEVSLRTLFAVPPGVTFEVSAGDNPNDFSVIYSKEGDKEVFYDPVITVPVKDKLLYIKLKMDYSERREFNPGESRLYRLNLYDGSQNGTKAFEESGGSYKYVADLETKKSNKWLFDSITNEGWLQAMDGIIFNYSGDPEKPLVYYFEFPAQVSNIVLNSKTYTFNNTITVSYSLDGANWLKDVTYEDNATQNHEIFLEDVNTAKFYVRYLCKITGSTCQVRDLSVEGIK
ncbi:hypothetical protein A3K34_03010 [candidate division WWE3 bacterium RIFOXYC1_FULL_40_10]|uniref:Glycosyltransferase RgtA/B/C/D-like domain-containing protein n=1 Tax=candidate division WWE3 bacterium RIFOXYA2_FULL_46_9 TaxID=1802636 RepID=A0A1F4W0G8_UNCKA|nr:MAG: hypothetical protein A3K58_03010 [candidate division WWE3 bacterium RIFOXYB1_FULL_40_22]OGC61817.1 MAG: hypothetical protein A3K37_03010 [candidate division WWE3 bacterium RIFOXYA1_FULL_40_11]OGC62835.1 MAG: hypothetical protein A2264_04170 [candidate division WWE3 bacterium RIFOXYA2_FULL_46_9]OGC64289.1 MAG: hypothetical protein A2326_00425 [candidate division WWE3 bacterium RIFOXYB2_FULL_41_6]OGC66200.1 MAG: hypothetical protein A3K34_03010 [candidate division WWE3 bacterium RIFOXYC1_